MDERRQLAAIMFSDIVGYSALMAEDETRALRLLKRSRQTIRRSIRAFHGQWLDSVGDGVLASFPSATQAVNCALGIQQRLRDEPDLRLRIGIHVGEVVAARGQVYGDGVNVASRIEALAPPGGIAVSAAVREAVKNKPGIELESLGVQTLRNIDHPVEVHVLTGTPVSMPDLEGLVADGRRRSPYLVVGAAAAVLIAVLAVAVMFHPQREGAIASMNTVAVLPFENLSDVPGNEYFSDGLAEELLAKLTRVEGLQVASRVSSFAFKGRNAGAREIAETLEVANLVEGSVRRQQDRVRVSVQLVDGRSGMRLWSETYERELDDIFSIQEDIAREIAGRLRVTLGPETNAQLARQPTENIEAYDYYLQGRAHLNRPVEQETLDAAESLFRRAARLDPGYARAFAGLCEVDLARFELSNAPRHYASATASCREALERDPELLDVRVTLANLHRESGEYDRAEAEFLEVLESLPNSTPALMGLAATYTAQNRYVEAEAMLRRAVRLQPGSWKTHMTLGEFLYWRLRYDEAFEAFQKVLRLSPGNARALEWIGAIQINRGELAAAQATLRQSLEEAPSRGVWRDLGLIAVYRGRFDRAIEAFENAIDLEPDDHWSWGELADAYHYSGRPEQARAAYTRARDLAAALLETNAQDWQTLSRLAIYEQRLGQTGRAAEHMQAARDNGGSLPLVMFHSAVLAMITGDEVAMFDDLRRAVDQGYPVALIRGNPVFAPLSGNPVFESLLESGGGS